MNRFPRVNPSAAWAPLAVLAAAVALVPLAGSRPSAAGPQVTAAAEGLWISDSPLDEARRLLIVVDPSGRHAAVYHVDSAAGTLALKSTRDISWDLMLDEFNCQEPRPAALKKMLQGQPGPGIPPSQPAR